MFDHRLRPLIDPPLNAAARLIVSGGVSANAVTLAGAAAAPQNLWPALTLVASFVLTAVSFLSFAALAAKRGLTTEAQGKKSFYYAAGLAEGGETIAVFIAFCLWPQWFGPLAYAFAALCLVTVAGRLAAARSLLVD